MKVKLGLFLCWVTTLAWGQGTPPRGYLMAELPSSARLVALGGANVSATQNDLSLFWANPALLGEASHHRLALGYQGYYQSSVLQASFGWHQSWGTIAGGVTAWNFGSVQGYDAAGVPTTTFSTGAWVASASYARQQGPFTMAASLKVARDQLMLDGGTALLADVAGLYQHPTLDLRVGVVASNLGGVLGGQATGEIPWDVRIGGSFKPEHMPFRISLTVKDLYRYDIVNFDSTTGREEEKPSTAQQLFAHVVIGGEIILGKSITGMVGFNPQRRIELQLPSFGGLTGFSFGLEARIKQFALGYGVAFQNLAGGTHQVTLTTDFSSWLVKERTVNVPIEGLE